MPISTSYAAACAQPRLEGRDLALTPILTLLAVAAILGAATALSGNLTLGVIAGVALIASTGFFLAPLESHDLEAPTHV